MTRGWLFAAGAETQYAPAAPVRRRFRRRPGTNCVCRGSLVRCAHSARLSAIVRAQKSRQRRELSCEDKCHGQSDD